MQFNFYDSQVSEYLQCEFEPDCDGDAILTKCTLKSVDVSGLINQIPNKEWEIAQAFEKYCKQQAVETQIDQLANRFAEWGAASHG